MRSGFGFAGALILRLDAAREAVGARSGRTGVAAGALGVDAVPALAEARDAGQALVVTADWPGGGHETRVVVPLAVEERCLGFLLAARLHGDETFGVDNEMLALLSALGAVAAVFVDKADHYGAMAGELAELQHSDRVKTDFVGIASHELRTPIAVVHGIAATLHLRGHELDGKQVAELRKTLYAQTTRLVELTQSLLDLSRIESG